MHMVTQAPFPMNAITLGETAYKANSGDVNKMQDVARQFEAVLLTTLLGPLQKSFSALPGASESSCSGEYQSLETQALATGLSAGGGLGIAAMISHNLLRMQDSNEKDLPKVPASPSDESIIR